jgi:hypothetical protein
MLAATFMELFTNLQGTTPSAEDQLHSYVSQLRSRGDAIHASGEKIVTLDNGFVTTELLANLEMKNNQSYNAPFALVSLQIQSRTITPPCFLAYFASCKRFADEVAPEIVAKYPVEGNFDFTHLPFFLLPFVVEEIGRGLADIATAVNQTRAVVRTLRKFIDLVCKKPHVFNPLYADFLQVLYFHSSNHQFVLILTICSISYALRVSCMVSGWNSLKTVKFLKLLSEPTFSLRII